MRCFHISACIGEEKSRSVSNIFYFRQMQNSWKAEKGEVHSGRRRASALEGKVDWGINVMKLDSKGSSQPIKTKRLSRILNMICSRPANETIGGGKET